MSSSSSSAESSDSTVSSKSSSVSDYASSTNEIELVTISNVVSPPRENDYTTTTTHNKTADGSSMVISDEQSDDPQALISKAENEAEPTLTLKNKTILLSDYAKQEFGNHTTSVEVRNVTYRIESQEQAGITTLATMFKKKKKFTKTILDDISFVLQPGETTVMLGGPGSGKTSLFDVIARRRKGDIEGLVTLNGRVADKKSYHRSVSYCVQDDIHSPLLTVRETLEFASNLQMPETATAEQKANRVDAVLQLLGLKHQENTVIGNAVLRGVSGGEKRRVSIGVEWVKGPRFFLLDEPTTGLDSAASLDIAKVLKVIARAGCPVLCALLQPSWEIVSEFDKLMIISNGKLAYHGPVNKALEYFAEIGYECPKNYSVSEFLSEVVDHPEKFPVDPESGVERKITTSDGFAEYWRSSPLNKEVEVMLKEKYPLKDNISKLDSSSSAVKLSNENDIDEYPTSLWEQTKLTFWRGSLLFKRDIRNAATIMINEAVLGLIIGAFFWNLPSTNGGYMSKLGLLFFCIAHICFSSISAIPVLFMERELYYSQRRAKYYSTFPYYFSLLFWSLPLVIAETILFGSIAYWMAGLSAADNGSRFIFFLLILVFTSLYGSTFAKAVSSVFPVAALASIFGSSITALSLLFSGFLVAKPLIPDGWIWMYWINPLHYMIEALAINEMAGQKIHCVKEELIPPVFDPLLNVPVEEGGFGGQQICPITDGSQVLKQTGFESHLNHRWAMFGALAGFYVLTLIVMYLGLRFCRFNPKKTGNPSKSLAIHEDENSNDKDALAKGATMVFRNLRYTVKVKKGDKLLLDNISGYVKPGMLLALMGASGAGKSTLLDVLAQRKNAGTIEGEIYVNGKKPNKFYPRLIGYVEQTDVLFGGHTVKESIVFSARCRLPEDMPQEKKDAVVARVMDLLDLNPIANELVGAGGVEGGLSLEQRKRVNIAVELASNPKILFLDEPTSGLDSDGADKVMYTIKKISDAGTSVICTIHQPSSRIFSRASHLLLLKKGGHMVYFGELGQNFTTLVGYFDSLGMHCPSWQNPAAFVLDATDAGLGRAAKKDAKDLETSFAESQMKQDLVKDVDTLVDNWKGAKEEDNFVRVFPLHWYQQVGSLMHRFFLNIWRTPKEIIATVMRAAILAFIFGTVFQLDDTPQSANARIALMFVSGIYANLTTFANMPTTFNSRPLFYRENASGYYRSSAYTLSKIISDLPLQLFGAILFATMLYWISGLRPEAGRFFFFLLGVVGLSMCALQYGQVLITFLPTIQAAGILFGTFFALFMLSAGFLIYKDDLPDYTIWLYWISFLHYSLEALTVNELQGLKIECTDNKGAYPIPTVNGTRFYCPLQNGDQIIDRAGMDPDMKWWDILILYGLYVVFILITVIGQKYIRHQKR